ncbi:MAG: hypothetical protein P8N09_00835 [Planctomycetota bacterium]|jgi:hypothetical protein|nr:hypothetical protein [Planctomycetota bacterium]
MNLSKNICLTAVLLLIASAGLLYPMHSSISELEGGIEELKHSTEVESTVPQQLAAVQGQLNELRLSKDDRTFVLCADTPEARNEFETALQEQIRAAGLSRISMDREAGFGGTDVPSFTISLEVEGDAFELHGFLQGLESLKWLTRVLFLQIYPGDLERRIDMQISVFLESDS